MFSSGFQCKTENILFKDNKSLIHIIKSTFGAFREIIYRIYGPQIKLSPKLSALQIYSPLRENPTYTCLHESTTVSSTLWLHPQMTDSTDRRRSWCGNSVWAVGGTRNKEKKEGKQVKNWECMEKTTEEERLVTTKGAGGPERKMLKE